MRELEITEGLRPCGDHVWAVWEVVHTELGRHYKVDPLAVCESEEAAEAALRLLSVP